MRVLIAGATGVIGRQLVPLLAAVGHEVVGMARPGGRGAVLEKAGARVVTADALDRAAVLRAVRGAAPDAVVNLLTAIPAELNPRRFAKEFAPTNRLRIEGTRNLVEAAGGARLVSEAIAFGYRPGAGLADEDAPLWTEGAPAAFAPALAALIDLERQTRDAGGLVLRFGHLYGPGSGYAPDGSLIRQIRAGRLPLAGGGHAVFSFTHAHDAATAVLAALDRPDVTGVLNVVDDTPVQLSEWLPALARMLGAPAPRRVPVALARLLAGGFGVAFLNQLRGADNARARLRLNWRPRYRTWADGFAVELNDALAGAA